MKILILSSNNPYISSGIVSQYLFYGFKKKGHFTKMIVKEHDDYKEKDIVCLDNKVKILINKIKNKIRKLTYQIFKLKDSNQTLNRKYYIQDYDQTIQNYNTKDILKYINFKPDIILYLFPNNFLNTKNLYELNKITGAPIFWYLMDSAALTGGCHYFWDCNRYISGCGSCPGLYSDDENDQTSINFNFKNKYISKTNIHIISGTERLREQSSESKLFKNKSIFKILLPVNHEIFKPAPKTNLRKKHNIPLNQKILFFGSNYLSTERKGIKYLIEALKLLKNNENVFLLVAGHHFEYIENNIPLDYKYLGILENNEQLAFAYQVSDLFVCPSIEDAGPLMINQSIMCGTPVVSFDMGVANDLIIDGKTGFKAELKNTKDLSKKIDYYLSLDDEEQQIMSSNCREFGLKYMKQSVFVNEFEDIFRNEIG